MAGSLPRSPLAPTNGPELRPVPGVRLATAVSNTRYKGRNDLALFAFADGTSVAGVLTRSRTPGHPVTWSRERLGRGRAAGLLVNAGNANVFNGADGDAACAALAEAVAGRLACGRDDVLLASTGVIGMALDPAPLAALLPALSGSLDADGWRRAAEAIRTTDTFAKGASRRTEIDGVAVTVTGIAKGSGMIAPDMATMLAFVATDAPITPEALRAMLGPAQAATFGATTVDGDTSTSDSLFLFATGQAAVETVTDAADPRADAFRDALTDVLRDLAIQVVRDGEGATKLIEIAVTGAADDASARRIGLAVANSPLVKTAIAGEDANWGRVVMAVGKAGEPVEAARLRIAFGGIDVAKDGARVAGLDEAPVTAHLKGREVVVAVDVGVAGGQAKVWTCDLTHGYIDINADYRS
ncbi:bifunctional glutamate N-acetyltransferase/amino-acid acetyltransferase ArgJ [Marinivivus vitaminiproducens]|uniref:bifunctional glutamate N-acetyltransferase/amino-acid acetyltransferase ArgJ n=1 Tax=Marinivivus vitaminiproducens TaxID=3035935 RepID=UPI0027A74541|nr:bifunctional glutamate N-acetyltransferase/amino-acid acetyltransferase ArgJ [Geminicoccaceae bacterium SCSIO 64248]